MSCTNKFNNILIPLIGGLGNQIFQLSFARRLISHGYNVSISTDILNSKLTHRALGWVQHNNSYATDFCNHLGMKIEFLKIMDISKLAKELILRRTFGSNIFDIDFDFIGDYIGCSNSSRIVLPGYFQTQRHVSFLNVKDVASEFLSFATKRVNLNAVNIRPVAVHVRRGEFPPSGILSKYYYNPILCQYDPEDIIFVTNDRNYVEEIYGDFINKGAIISMGVSFYDDFFILAGANILILSSSTFAYAAACSGNAKIIFYPDKFSSAVKYKFPITGNFISSKSFFESESAQI